MERDPNGTPQSDYDGSHISVDVRRVAPTGVRAPANRDATGDGIKDFYSSPKPRR